MHRRQQPKEQLCISDAVVLSDLGCRMMQACSYQALSPFPGSLWITVLSKAPRPSSAQSMPSFDVMDADEGCCITNALQEHALALHQMLLSQGGINSSDPRRLEPSTCPGEVNEIHTPSSSLRNSLIS